MHPFVSRGLLPALGIVLGLILGADALAADSPPTAVAAAAAGPKAPPHAAAAKSGAIDPALDKTLYALGVLVSRNFATFQLTEAEFARVRAGLVDGFHNKPEAATADTELPQIQALQRTRMAALTQHQKEIGQAYLDKAVSAPGATKTASGMVYTRLTEGSGPSPLRTDTIKATYEGRLIDGTVFDSSAQHGGQPTAFPVGNIIPCWTEALQLMKAGGKSRVVCPPALAYGDRGRPPKIMPGATLVFDIELVSIEPPPPAAAAPAAPAGAGVPPAKGP